MMHKDLSHIKGIIFDFGGTLDTHGVHWSEQFWDAWQAAGATISKPIYEKAYVAAGDSMLEGKITPTHTFRETIGMQISLQLEYLVSSGHIDPVEKENLTLAILDACYADVKAKMKITADVLRTLAKTYPLVLVSNYYGNMETVLREFEIREYFRSVVDSALVGIRKPDPAIFALGVERLGLQAAEVAVVGDSFERDIVPGKKNGCTTIWLKGRSWREEPGGPEADIIIPDLATLKKLL